MFGTKLQKIKFIQITNSLYIWSFQSLNVESGLVFSIWSCKLRTIMKRKLRIKLAIWFSSIPTWETWVKWPLIEMCDMELKKSHWELQHSWKLLNERSYEVTSLQGFEKHVFSRLFQDTFFSKQFSPFLLEKVSP